MSDDDPPPATLPDFEAQAIYARLSAEMFGEHAPHPHIGRFRVERRIGAGGMGIVLEATDPTLGRRVAVKLLRGSRRAAAPEALLDEARALARLSHPNVVHVYEAGVHDGDPYIAMELVQGQTLAQWQSQPRGWRECVGAYLQAGRGLAAAHEVGLVHRDFKPSNALIDERGRVRVLDFGLARWFQPTTPIEDEPSAGSGTSTTRAAGTPAYMSPEQRRGDPVGPATDQYSFCIALHQAITGELPGQGRATRSDTARPIPKWLDATLQRGRSPDPAHRFASMEQLLARLERPPTRRLWAVAAVVAVGAWLFGRDWDPQCEVEASIDSAWNEQVRHALRGGFRATRHPDADDVSESVVGALDAAAEQWEVARHQVCTQPRDQEEQRVAHYRTECLNARHQELGTLVAMLTQPTDEEVVYALEMVSDLRHAEMCLDPIHAQSRLPPADKVEAIMEQQTRLARARFHASAGQYPRAREILTGVEGVARTLGYGPLLAEALIEHGRIEARTGQRKRALERFDEATDVALRDGDAETEVDARLHAARVLVFPLERFDHAQAEIDDASARAAALPASARRDAEISVASGLLALARDDAEHARRELERALEIFREDPAGDELHIAEVLLLLGNAASLEARPEEALQYYAEVLERRAHFLGPRHPRVGIVHGNIGTVERERGNLDEAQRAFERSLAILDRPEVHGGYLVELTGAQVGLADVLTLRGEYERAVALAESADELLAPSYPPIHSQRVAATEALCNALTGREDLERALGCYRRLLGLHEAGAQRIEVTSLQVNVGSTLVSLGWHREARAHYEQVLPEIRVAFEQQGQAPLFALPLRSYAEALEMDGESALATSVLERARRVLATSRAKPLPEILAGLVTATHADVDWSLARKYRELGRRAEAVELALEARAQYEELDATREVTEIDRWLERLATPPPGP